MIYLSQLRLRIGKKVIDFHHHSINFFSIPPSHLRTTYLIPFTSSFEVIVGGFSVPRSTCVSLVTEGGRRRQVLESRSRNKAEKRRRRQVGTTKVDDLAASAALVASL